MAISMYINQPGAALDSATTHPHFKEHFKASFYLDEQDSYGPFGYEDGLEVLRRLEEYFSDKSDQGLNLAAFPKYMMETVKKANYVPAKDDGVERLQQLLAEFGSDVRASDRITVSAALAQIKITGYVLPALRDAALEALHREIELNKIEDIDAGYADSMFYDLLTFTKDYTSVLPDMWCRHCTE
ncbi:molybdate metabolism regulator [Listeria monocytogenes]|nr:molybdate metabolism regulator [Listeria monocytogenes]EHZ2232229.1 molybdate metabolism regulator [Listeria monocytogenes]